MIFAQNEKKSANHANFKGKQKWKLLGVHYVGEKQYMEKLEWNIIRDDMYEKWLW